MSGQGVAHFRDQPIRALDLFSVVVESINYDTIATATLLLQVSDNDTGNQISN